MNVKDTSRAAFAEMQPHLQPMQQRIVSCLAMHDRPFTRNELAALTGIAIPSICGRIKELLDAGVLVEGVARACRVSGS